MSEIMTEIKYGHVNLPFGPNKSNVRCGYATFKEDDATIELISVPYGGLWVRRNGEIIERPGTGTGKYTMAWAKVASWLGNQEFADRWFKK